MNLDLKDAKIAIVGLGYVGLPLALEMSKYSDVIGFDINEARIQTLQNRIDSNGEVDENLLQQSACHFTDDIADIADCNIYIVTVPTPIDAQKNPDLTPLIKASEAIGALIGENDIIVYESTVYPCVTEDICAPILEKMSGLKSGEGFFLGYSPERINPGDTVNTLVSMAKIVAGQTPEITDYLAALYGQINNGNIFKAKNIKTAEAAKAIENAQRDINVAFINEVTMILNKVGLSSHDVLEAAGTKWNFLPFSPGLVGGHCIGVDPYYLAKCAIDNDHDPRIILSGRDINDAMGVYFAQQLSDAMGAAGKVLVMGFTFKENISDTRNTKVADLVDSLAKLGHDVDAHDPHAVPQDVQAEYGISLCENLGQDYDALVLAVGHDQYLQMGTTNIADLLKAQGGVIYDIKSAWKKYSFKDTIQYLSP